jgi:hypothetical protein
LELAVLVRETVRGGDPAVRLDAPPFLLLLRKTCKELMPKTPSNCW